MSKEAVKWCQNSLYDVLGYTDKALAEYLVNLAGQSRGAGDLLAKLLENDFPQTEKTKTFCTGLLSKARPAPVPVSSSSSSSSSSSGPGRLTNADLLRQSQSYGLVDMDPDADLEELFALGTAAGDAKKVKKDKKEKKESKKRKDSERKDGERGSNARVKVRGGDESSEEEEEAETRARISGVIRGVQAGDGGEGEGEDEDESSMTPEQLAKRQMDRDIAERDAFALRMQTRDQSKTKKVAPQAAGEASSSAMGGSDKPVDKSTLDTLREISRQHYLEKREEKELKLLEMSVRDEGRLFEGVEVTHEERKKLELNKRILEMAQDKNRFSYKNDGYQMPDSYDDAGGKGKRDALLTSRYEEEEKPLTEQQMWEEEQLRVANRAVAKETGQRPEGEQQYDFVFDDQIDFISQSTLAGNRKDHKFDQQEAMGAREDDAALALAKTRMTEHEKILEGRKKLPVYAYRDEFLAAVQDNKVLIVVGETGSGKTTQIPQYLHEAGWSKLGKIGCTQPRRVAAMSVAARVAVEMDVRLGQEVGYSIRFEDCTSESTLLKYMTDGMLLREFLTEPDLSSYSALVIDEAHERTLSTDVLFGLVKDIARFRDEDFRLVISSATLDAEKFSAYFDDAAIFMIPGRMFPVDIMYTKAPEADYLDAVVVTILQIHVSQDVPGDILVFLTGQEEIETVMEQLATRTKGLGSKIRELMVAPIYAQLPSDMQAKIFENPPYGGRKVVLGTNIAETSLTIDGICYVIDTGFHKQKSYNPRRGMESLVVQPVSKAAANQRAGRAGRTQPGKCFRLYTNWSYINELDAVPTPEIQRTNMNDVVLKLKSLGINDLLHFDFMDKPPAEALMRALEQLYALGGLNDRGELTKLGRRMAEFPLDCMMSKALIVSETYGCSMEVLTIVSMLSIGAGIFYRPKDKAVHADVAKQNFARGGGGDHLTLLRVYSQWEDTNFSTQWCYENYLQVRAMNQARDVREQLEGLCERTEVVLNTNPTDIDNICKALCSGYFYHAAKLGKGGEYKTVKHQQAVHVHPSSVMARGEDGEKAGGDPPRWLMYHELAFTSKEYMRAVCPIRGEWLVEIAPHYYAGAEVEDSTSKKMPKGRGKPAE